MMDLIILGFVKGFFTGALIILPLFALAVLIAHIVRLLCRKRKVS